MLKIKYTAIRFYTSLISPETSPTYPEPTNSNIHEKLWLRIFLIGRVPIIVAIVVAITVAVTVAHLTS